MVVNRKPRITVEKRTRKIFDYIREIRERFKQIQWIEGLEWGGLALKRMVIWKNIDSYQENGIADDFREINLAAACRIN